MQTLKGSCCWTISNKNVKNRHSSRKWHTSCLFGLVLVGFQVCRRLPSWTKTPIKNAKRQLNRFLLVCLPVRKGGLGICDPTLVLGPAFIASNFRFAGSRGELPGRFCRELSDAWSTVLKNCIWMQKRSHLSKRLNLSNLTNLTNQRRWQEQVDARMEAHFSVMPT